MKALLLIALLVCASHAAIQVWNHNDKMYNNVAWTAGSWEKSQETLYTAASSATKGKYLFASTWGACKTAMATDFGYDDAGAAADVANNLAFNNLLNSNTNCATPMGAFSAGTSSVLPFSPVSFQLVKCYKELDAAYPTKTTEMTEYLNCLKSSLAAVDLDVTKDFFFSEKLGLYHNFQVMDEWVESDWTYATLGGFSNCVMRKCNSMKFFDETFNNAANGIWGTEWGRTYHIDIGTKIEASCDIKVGTTPKAGTALDSTKYNACFKALIPHMIGADRELMMCYSMCANPPSLFKGPYGPNPVVNSAVDGEIYTSTSDGEFIREKAKILNDLVTCTNKISRFDMTGPIAAPLAQQTNYFSDAAKYTTPTNGANDSAYDYLASEASSNDEVRFCFYQNEKCREFWNFVHHDYQSTLFYSKKLSDCIDACLPAGAGATFAGGSTAKPFAGKDDLDEPQNQATRAEYLKCNAQGSHAWNEMISSRMERTGATILTVAVLIMAVLTFIF